MNLSHEIKKILVRIPFFSSLAARLTRKRSRIFLYHRFCKSQEESIHKIDEDTFEWQLKQLAKGWKVITLSEYIRYRREGIDLPYYSVILTIDDGYADFYEIAYVKLLQYGMTATLFPTVNFVDGKIWLWPDRVQYILENTREKQLSFEFSTELFKLNLESVKRKTAAWGKLVGYCLNADNETKWAFISKLEEISGVNLPALPPAGFASVTWDQLKEMSGNGIEIGSHTLNHPILSRLKKEEELTAETALSKEIFEEKLGKPVESFCYPNGCPKDINASVLNHVKMAGYKGAVVVTMPGISDLYKIPRMGVSRDKTDFLWKLCGMEAVILTFRTNFKHLINVC